MNESTIQGDFGELRMETEMIDITSSGPRPDKGWTYIDQQGHEHRYDDGYPTLVRVVDSTYVDEDGDEYEESHLECRECGERITPGMVGPSRFREMVPGRTAYYLNGEPISPARFKELAESAGF